LAACPQKETPQTDRCRVYDNSTDFFYDVSPLKNVPNKYITVSNVSIHRVMMIDDDDNSDYDDDGW
jgi:hypothetical protein